MKSRWKNLSECSDFDKVFNKIKLDYVENYINILDEIEREIQNYLDSTEEEWQEVVENGNVPESVKWYCGMIDTEYFLNECWL